jgi:hypothetical protein
MKLEPGETSDVHVFPILQRFFCHALISCLPDEALSETEERLAEIHEDFLPRQATHHLSKPQSSTVFTAQLGQYNPRPEIEFED